MSDATAAADLMFRPVGELAGLVRSGELSARELVQSSLDRIEALDGEVNAFVDVWAEEALADADAIGPGDERPFAGVPIAIKNNRAVEGRRLTYGADLFGDFRRPMRPQRRPPPEGGRLRPRGLDDAARVRDPPGDRDPPLRPDAQPVGPVPDAGRLLRRLGRGGRRRHGADRARQRRRRLDPDPGRVLRAGRAQAPAGPDLARPGGRRPVPRRRRRPDAHGVRDRAGARRARRLRARRRVRGPRTPTSPSPTRRRTTPAGCASRSRRSRRSTAPSTRAPIQARRGRRRAARARSGTRSSRPRRPGATRALLQTFTACSAPRSAPRSPSPRCSPVASRGRGHGAAELGALPARARRSTRSPALLAELQLQAVGRAVVQLDLAVRRAADAVAGRAPGAARDDRPYGAATPLEDVRAARGSSRRSRPSERQRPAGDLAPAATSATTAPPARASSSSASRPARAPLLALAAQLEAAQPWAAPAASRLLAAARARRRRRAATRPGPARRPSRAGTSR